MSQQTHSTIEALRLAIHGVTAPFSSAGRFVPDKPVALVFKDKTRFEVCRARTSFEQQSISGPLLKHCTPAPFGHKKKTRFDRTVRDALQLKAEGGAFAVENFDPGSAGILDQLQRELLPHDPSPISAEFYSVNVYTDGGHFAPHKDTPRGGDSFGTLVVCLASQFSGGALVLNHRGVVQKFDWGRTTATQPNEVYWAAYFGDVDHQIKQIYSGVRVTLAYNLRRGDGEPPARAAVEVDLAPRIREAWLALLADPSFLPEGGILGYPCCHLYHQDARFQQTQSAIAQESVTMLKGRDHLVAATALAAGLTVSFAPYAFENCADETWQLERFPTPKEQSRLRSRMDETALKRALTIRASSEDEGDFGVTWVEPRPTSDTSSWREDQGEDAQTAAAAHLHSCEYCAWGNFGNEASEIDLYTYAALHVKIPPAGKGVRAAKKPATRAPAKRAPASRKRKPSEGQ